MPSAADASPKRRRPRPRGNLLASTDDGVVAVVGAGFGGLAVARAIQLRRLRKVVVFEANPLGVDCIQGEIRLASGSRTMGELGLGRAWEELCGDSSSGPSVVSYPGLLRALADSLLPGTIRFGKTVRSVHAVAGGLQLSFADGKTVEVFDHVVAADGLRSSLRRGDCADERLSFIGDARWAFGRWWDLGRRRLAHGADTALQDALELSRLLHSSSDGLAATASSSFHITPSVRDKLQAPSAEAVRLMVAAVGVAAMVSLGLAAARCACAAWWSRWL